MNKPKIINESIDYIIKHLDENISVEDVANYFHFSKYYFARVFKEVTGESVYAFIKRLRMDQSAVDIKLERHKMIADIGLDYGYSSSNYSSAFKGHHQISPTNFRKSVDVTSVFNPFFPQEMERFNTFHEYDKHITIQDIDEVFIIYKRFIGNYIELKENWYKFTDAYNNLMNKDTLLIEKFYNDPMITGLNQCICDLCMTVPGVTEIDNAATIEGGRFAVYRYDGKIHDVFRTVQGVFCIWLSDSGYEMNQRYGLNVYRQIDRNNDSVVMDIRIPIK